MTGCGRCSAASEIAVRQHGRAASGDAPEGVLVLAYLRTLLATITGTSDGKPALWHYYYGMAHVVLGVFGIVAGATTAVVLAARGHGLLAVQALGACLLACPAIMVIGLACARSEKASIQCIGTYLITLGLCAPMASIVVLGLDYVVEAIWVWMAWLLSLAVVVLGIVVIAKSRRVEDCGEQGDTNSDTNSAPPTSP